MQVSGRGFVHVTVFIMMTLGLALSAQAATFNNASLKGSYSFLTSLSTADVNTPQFAMVGVMTFDGAGNVTGSYTSILHDTVQSGALGGTYSVSSNGTGTITLTTGSNAQFAIVLNSTTAKIAHGLQLLQINDSNNEIISGTAVQQALSGTYSVASLKGTLAFQYNPRTADVTQPQDGGVGLFTFDGKGNVKSFVTIVFDGQIFGGNGSFTYTVNPDGSGTITPTGKGPHIAFALNSVTNGLAKGLQFLDTNTSDGSGNMIITGSAVKQ